MQAIATTLGVVLMSVSATGCDQGPDARPVPPWEDLGLAPVEWHDLRYQEPYLYVIAKQEGAWRADVSQAEVQWEFLGQEDLERRDGGATNTVLVTVAHNPRDPNHLVAARRWTCCESVPLIHSTTDGGVFWAADLGLSYQIDEFTVHRTASTFFIVGDSLLGLSAGALLISKSRGVWRVLNPNPSPFLVFAQSPVSEDLIWGGETKFFHDQSLNIGFSADGGRSWQATGSRLPNRIEYSRVSSIGLDATNTDQVYVGIDGRVQAFLSSSDSGSSWRPLQPGDDTSCCRLVAASSNRSGLVWASEGDSLYVSEDSGLSWTTTNFAEGPHGEIRALAPHADRDVLFVLSSDGVYRHNWSHD